MSFDLIGVKYNPSVARLAERLTDLAEAKHDNVFFSNVADRATSWRQRESGWSEIVDFFRTLPRFPKLDPMTLLCAKLTVTIGGNPDDYTFVYDQALTPEMPPDPRMQARNAIDVHRYVTMLEAQTRK